MKNFLKKIILGSSIPLEYPGVDSESFKPLAKVILQSNNLTLDVTSSHLFIGYKPLVIALPISKSDENFPQLDCSEKITLEYIFLGEQYASLSLKKVYSKEFDSVVLFIFEGIEGNSKMFSPFYRFTNKAVEKIRKKQQFNVNLNKNLYEQVKIAYSIPRLISLVALGENGKYNLFPTDLNGQIDEKNFLLSLRSEGKVNKQLNDIKKAAIFRMSANTYKDVFMLGKNHMKDLQPTEVFNITQKTTDAFNLPIPSGAVEYKELEWIDSLVFGIHQLNFMRIVNRVTLTDTRSTLAHIHREAISYRKRKSIPTEYLLR